MDTELEHYYEDQYRRMLRTTEIPKPVMDAHQRAKALYDRAGGGEMPPVLLMAVVLVSGVEIAPPGSLQPPEEPQKSPAPKMPNPPKVK